MKFIDHCLGIILDFCTLGPKVFFGLEEKFLVGAVEAPVLAGVCRDKRAGSGSEVPQLAVGTSAAATVSVPVQGIEVKEVTTDDVVCEV